MDDEKEEISGTVFADAWDDPDIDMENPEIAKAVLEVSKNVKARQNDRWYHKAWDAIKSSISLSGVFKWAGSVVTLVIMAWLASKGIK